MGKLLVFQHIEREHPSRISQYASERGLALDVVQMWKPYTLPDIATYDGLIVLGGPMGVYEDFPSKEDELEVIRKYQNTLPILGICLGAQLAAHALGANVYPHTIKNTHIKEVGYCTVALTGAGEESVLFKNFSHEFKVLQWHGDTFDLPAGASLLTQGSRCKNQAFAKGMVSGVQFHFEITPSLLKIVADSDDEWAHEGMTESKEDLIKLSEELEPIMEKQCYQLLDNFLGSKFSNV